MDATRGGEWAAIGRISQMLPGPPPGQTWIGDDAAVLPPTTGRLLLTADAVVAGVHADMGLVGLDDFGWKALAAAVSDVAAMGGIPRWALVTVCGPPDTDLDLLYRGIADAAAHHACPVVGGDLSGAGGLMVSVAVVGDSGTSPAVLRSGACPGDRLFVTGPLGGSAAGLRRLRAGPVTDDDPLVRAYRRPLARIAEGRAARSAGASAMVDISDGLTTDLGHLADASAVGVALENVPACEGATAEEAAAGGEDYELIFAAPNAGAVAAVFTAAGLRRPVPIGICTADPADRTLGGSSLPRGGWEHAWSSG